MLFFRLTICLLPLRCVLGCNSTKACDYPANTPFTVNYEVTPDGRLVVNSTVQDCCAVMPAVPLVDTGEGEHARVVRPPSMNTSGAICPDLPDDVVIAQGLNPWRNGTLYKHEKIFFVNGLDHGGPDGYTLPKNGLSVCAQPHPFYNKYVLARKSGSVDEGIPVLGSAAAPDAAMLKAADTIGEMLRQMDSKIPGLRKWMVKRRMRFAVWADSERRLDTCKTCTALDPTFDCGAHIDSRAGRDTSYHPEMPECVEGGGSQGLEGPTGFTEEYGIPYLDADGSVRDSYCGTNIVAHEFFHTIHNDGIQDVARPLFLRIEQAAARGVKEGIYVHHPGAKDDGCNPDFTGCVTYEFIVKAHMTWNGFPADKREFAYSSRSEMKEKAPWLAEVIYEMFEDGNWNSAMGAVINTPRDQTFNLTCATAPGSALCGKELSKAYIGRPMAEVLADCGGSCWHVGVENVVV